DVLAAGSDQELLLAIGDAQITLVVEFTDVAGMQESFGVERLAGGLRVLEIAEEDVRSAREDLAVRRDADLEPFLRPADGADAAGVRQIRGPHRGALRHAPDVEDGQAERVEELERRGVDLGRAGDAETGAVEAQFLANEPWREPDQQAPQRRLELIF